MSEWEEEIGGCTNNKGGRGRAVPLDAGLRKSLGICLTQGLCTKQLLNGFQSLELTAATAAAASAVPPPAAAHHAAQRGISSSSMWEKEDDRPPISGGAGMRDSIGWTMKIGQSKVSERC